MRGERASRLERVRTYSGSSPHARGTLGDVIQLAGGRRFIPAYAGNAALSALRRSWAVVHPCIRRERTVARKSSPPQAGSSPHTRGTRLSTFERISRLRFIPACAGNARPDTPVTPMAIGSSPHARGTRPCRRAEASRRRFIPAYAGNAHTNTPAKPQDPVHPRIRGERELALCVLADKLGSSPHTRGTPVCETEHAIR